MVRCPICDLPSPNAAKLCECGYEHATGFTGTAIEKLEQQQSEARGLLVRGGLTMASVIPLLALFALSPAWLLLVAPVVGLAQVGLGASWTLRGLNLARDTRKRLRAARQLGQLPPARLLPAPTTPRRA